MISINQNAKRGEKIELTVEQIRNMRDRDYDRLKDLLIDVDDLKSKHIPSGFSELARQLRERTGGVD